jgi:hypothetical protein
MRFGINAITVVLVKKRPMPLPAWIKLYRKLDNIAWRLYLSYGNGRTINVKFSLRDIC